MQSHYESAERTNKYYEEAPLWMPPLFYSFIDIYFDLSIVLIIFVGIIELPKTALDHGL